MLFSSDDSVVSKIYVCKKFYKKFTSTSWSFLKESLYATWLSENVKIIIILQFGGSWKISRKKQKQLLIKWQTSGNISGKSNN